MADQIPPIVKALEAIRGTGRFHSTGVRPVALLGLRLGREEELAFPLPRAQAAAIKARAEPAPYGRGEETIHDEKVRKCWQVDASKLKWKRPEWDRLLSGIVSSVASDLGIDGKVKAEPYKLLLYEKGGFFRPHRDTEKLGAMFGTLILALPSAHKGGRLLIRHHGEEVSVDFAGEQGMRSFQYAAFFADCEHEVERITSGYRLCLVFNLILEKGDASRLNRPAAVQATALIPHLQKLARTEDSDLCALLLEHRYTSANLSIRSLKNHDRARAEALLIAAGQADFVAHLALVSLYQMGQLDSDDYGYGGGDTEDGVMGEILDENLTISAWRDSAGRRLRLGDFRIDPSRILASQAIDEGEPDEQFAEGYTGNAGCTMEHWYRRAAIVIWPQIAQDRVLAHYRFEETAAALLRKASRAGAGDQPAFHLTGRALLAEADARLGSSNASYWRSHSCASALPILDAIATAKCRALLDACSESLLFEMLSRAGAPLWGKILAAFGDGIARRWLAWFGAGPEDESVHRQDALLSALGGLLALKPVPSVAVSFANRLAESPDIAECNRPSHRKPGDASIATPELRLHMAIAASHLVTPAKARTRLRENILGEDPLNRVRDCLGQALLIATHRRHFAHPKSLFHRLLEDSLRLLREEIARPLKPYPDWRRPCPPIGEERGRKYGLGYAHSIEAIQRKLADFMADPAAEVYSFKYPQAERTQLEEFIRRHALDLVCRTVKEGAPHSLVCRKNSASHARALNRRAADKVLLAKLKKLM
ncbi:MAG TPA: hypothetical protein VMN36_12705 [Verrucomicrobiales bacterium]|nr:hypothetical protein [Verrucomicrobiales bacterium]